MRQAPAASFEQEVDVAWWEAVARPEVLYLMAEWASVTAEPGSVCPSVHRNGSVDTIEGGCTDKFGKAWTGRARRLRVDGGFQIRMKDFGHDKARYSGRVQVFEDGHRFDMDLVYEGTDLTSVEGVSPKWLAFDVSGERAPDGRWRGEGKLAADGHGRVKMKASDLAFDSASCKTEPLSGTLQLWAGGHAVEVDYDGRGDCDPVGTARWSRDGVDQGELEGISGGLDCNPTPSQDSPAPAALLLVLGVSRRRRRRR
ncbi:MAG: hypothetical protein K0V04_41765 [Deltaproteobacteria bacterium]|nr:hypothetical protein [Deltaproteobacteria bacterium]